MGGSPVKPNSKSGHLRISKQHFEYCDNMSRIWKLKHWFLLEVTKHRFLRSHGYCISLSMQVLCHSTIWHTWQLNGNYILQCINFIQNRLDAICQYNKPMCSLPQLITQKIFLIYLADITWNQTKSCTGFRKKWHLEPLVTLHKLHSFPVYYRVQFDCSALPLQKLRPETKY